MGIPAIFALYREASSALSPGSASLDSLVCPLPGEFTGQDFTDAVTVQNKDSFASLF